MRLGLIHAQPLHEPAVLLGCQTPCFAFLPGPLERTGLQSLVQQHKSVALPVQRLDPIPASATEQEERVAEGIQRHLLLDQGGQTVDPTAKVGVAALDENVVCATEIIQHDFNTRSTDSMVDASAPL